MRATTAARAVLASLATTVIVTSAHAQLTQPVDKRTFYTFSTQVELPGVTLEAGKYLFRIVDTDTSRTIWQVVNDDTKKVHGMFFTLPIQAAEIPDKPTVRFMESAAGAPAPIRAIWYPGDRTGREFIYPRSQATRLAKSAQEPVLATAGNSATVDRSNSGDLVRIAPDGGDVQVDTQARVETPPATVGTSGRAASAEPTQVARNEPRSSLPATASSQPALALAGLCLLAAAAAVRFARLSRR